MKKMMTILVVAIVLTMSFGSFSSFSQTEIIDTTNLSKGIVSIAYKTTDTVTYKVLISKDDKKISYPFTKDGSPNVFPLQMGNGTYKIGLLKNTTGTKYAYVSQKTVVLELKDSNVVFLNSIQNVNWNADMEAIEFGKTLLKTSTTSNKKLQTLYGYLVKSMSYDYDKIPKLTPDYVPSVEQTYEDLKGICYDYSALFASIQRDQGIPTKLVKGYSKFVEGYHAWNEILIDGKWVIIDNTVDNTSRSGVKMIKDPKDYTKVYEY